MDENETIVTEAAPEDAGTPEVADEVAAEAPAEVAEEAAAE